MKLCVLVMAAALGAGTAAWASEPVATAGGAGSAPSTADQIDAYLKTSPIPALPDDGAQGATTSGPADRRIHGVVEVGVGTGGYRHAFVAAEMPLGQNGALSVAVDQTQGRGRFGAWRGQGLGASLALGPDAQAAGCPLRDRIDADRMDLGRMDLGRGDLVGRMSGCRGVQLRSFGDGGR